MTVSTDISLNELAFRRCHDDDEALSVNEPLNVKTNSYMGFRKSLKMLILLRNCCDALSICLERGNVATRKKLSFSTSAGCN